MTGLFGVMDGLGGKPYGDLASKAVERQLPEQFSLSEVEAATMAPEELIEKLTEMSAEKFDGRSDYINQKAVLHKKAAELVAKDAGLARKSFALLQAMQNINRAVQATRGETTACVGLIHETAGGEKYAVIANVGDSGAFIRRSDGRVERVTPEDSVQEALKEIGAKIDNLDLDEYLRTNSDPISGKIRADLPIKIPLTLDNVLAIGYTKDDFVKFEKQGKKTLDFDYYGLKATLTSSLGMGKAPTPSVRVIKVEKGDELLFCTDGVIDKYEDEDKQTTDLEELGKDLELGTDPIERLNSLRVMATQRMTYKISDDIAMALIQVK